MCMDNGVFRALGQWNVCGTERRGDGLDTTTCYVQLTYDILGGTCHAICMIIYNYLHTPIHAYIVA